MMKYTYGLIVCAVISANAFGMDVTDVFEDLKGLSLEELEKRYEIYEKKIEEYDQKRQENNSKRQENDKKIEEHNRRIKEFDNKYQNEEWLTNDNAKNEREYIIRTYEEIQKEIEDIKKERDVINIFSDEGRALRWAMVMTGQLKPKSHDITNNYPIVNIDFNNNNNNNDTLPSSSLDKYCRRIDESGPSNNNNPGVAYPGLQARQAMPGKQSNASTSAAAELNKPAQTFEEIFASSTVKKSKRASSEDPILAERKQLEHEYQELENQWNLLSKSAKGTKGQELANIADQMDDIETQKLKIAQQLDALKNGNKKTKK